jgi:hypothetical protein
VDLAAGAVFAVLEQLHRTLTSGRGVDRVDGLVEGHRFAETDRGERGTGAEAKNGGHDGRDGFESHCTLLDPIHLGQVPGARGFKSIR